MKCGVVLSFILLAPAWAADPVYFADPRLKAVVEEELWISDPTPSDMLGLTSLSSQGLRIEDLTGLEYATNLNTLWMPHNEISDLTPLSGLTNLQEITLNNNAVSDLCPLSGLHNLWRLDAHDNHITDVSCLSGMENLEAVILRLNEISDISAFSTLTNLRSIDLSGNDILDISPLTGLTSLGQLDLRDNPLNDEACSLHIPQILANNPGILFQHPPCVSYRLLVVPAVGGAVVSPGEGEFLYEQGAAVRLEARADPGFVFVSWSGSYSTQDNPLSLRMNQDHNLRANFVSVLDVIHVDDDGPRDPGPFDPAVSDPAENGTGEHPFDRIQEAIDVAAEGATLFVHGGTYRETIDLLGKCITLTGFDPDNPGVSSWPVVDGGGAGPVVSFTHGEDPNCVLCGFVVTGGRGRTAGAILCSAASPTVANCLIVGNRATDSDGAAVYCIDSDATFINCTISGNRAGPGGAALRSANSHIVVLNSILWGDTPMEVVVSGPSEPLVGYSAVAGGWAGGLDADPRFAQAGYWAAVAVGPDAPDAVWVRGDYHLRSQAGRYDSGTGRWAVDSVTSPCIDAGDPSSPVGWESSPHGGIINMGAYGGTSEAGKSPCEIPVDFADANLRAAVEEALWISDPTPIDMLGLTHLVCPTSYTHADAIRDLAGLEYAGNLQELNLQYHRISDIAVLSGLNALQVVNLLGNTVRDISPLSGLSHLRTLDLEQNQVIDISALSELRRLESVGLHRNFISDIWPLTGLTRLVWVDLRANPLSQKSYDVYLSQMASKNPGVTLLYDALFRGRLELSSAAGGSVIRPGEGEFTYAFYESVVLEAQADPGFEFVNWSGTLFTSENPLVLLMDQDHSLQANFQAKSATP
jgi:Leucine-rich repeat (LRR) protein